MAMTQPHEDAWKRKKHKSSMSHQRVMPQTGSFRSFVLEVTRAWELVVNEIKDRPGPVASGVGSKTST